MKEKRTDHRFTKCLQYGHSFYKREDSKNMNLNKTAYFFVLSLRYLEMNVFVKVVIKTVYVNDSSCIVNIHIDLSNIQKYLITFFSNTSL